MSPIDQARPFQQRLADFGPELGAFLGRVWQSRGSVNRSSFNEGVSQIYRMYSGNEAARPYDAAGLDTFIADLRSAAGGYAVICQVVDKSLAELGRVEVQVYGRDLWTDFYHVLSTPSPASAIRSRVYVHASGAPASIGLMRVIIDQFGKNAGLWEAKTAGPGSLRLDTIVCYLYDSGSADALVKTLRDTAAQHPDWITASLPPLVQRAADGIGIADEPPAIEIFRRGGTRHSFGSFMSTLCWVALRTTPNIATPAADGRHMLDNMLFALRALRVDPKSPQRFPEAPALEAWFSASVR
jgi:hypothetical protein